MQLPPMPPWLCLAIAAGCLFYAISEILKARRGEDGDRTAAVLVALLGLFFLVDMHLGW